MRNQLAISVLIAALVPACASHVEDEVLSDPLATLPICAGDIRNQIEQIVIAHPIGNTLDDSALMVPQVGHVLDESRPACACTTADCMLDWIQVNVGCDVCADLQCGAGAVCVPCASQVEVGSGELDHPCLVPPAPVVARE